VRSKLVRLSTWFINILSEAKADSDWQKATEEFESLMNRLDEAFDDKATLGVIEQRMGQVKSGHDDMDFIDDYRVNNRYVRCWSEALEALKPFETEEGQLAIEQMLYMLKERGLDNGLWSVGFNTFSNYNDSVRVQGERIRPDEEQYRDKLVPHTVIDGTIYLKTRLQSKATFWQQLGAFKEASEAGSIANGGLQDEGIVDLTKASTDVLFIGDIQARSDNLEEILNNGYPDGKSVIQRVQDGELTLLFAGDYMHEDEARGWFDQYLPSLITLQNIMQLKIDYPKSVYLLAGNHDVTPCTKKNAEQSIACFETMQTILGRDTRSSSGVDSLAEIARDAVDAYYSYFVSSLALGAIGKNVAAFHAGPPTQCSLDEVKGMLKDEELMLPLVDTINSFRLNFMNPIVSKEPKLLASEEELEDKGKEEEAERLLAERERAFRERYAKLIALISNRPDPGDEKTDDRYLLSDVTAFFEENNLPSDSYMLTGHTHNSEVTETPFRIYTNRVVTTVACNNRFGYIYLSQDRYGMFNPKVIVTGLLPYSQFVSQPESSTAIEQIVHETIPGRYPRS
jgi:hypothetical protein